MKDKQMLSTYQQLWIAYYQRLERWLCSSILILFILLLLFQWLLQFESIRVMITEVDRLEGSQIQTDCLSQLCNSD